MNDFTILCRNCGWHWQESESKAADMYICHKCGFDNKFRNQKDNFRNVVSITAPISETIFSPNVPDSGVLSYKFSNYYTARNYSIMSCDELKLYSVELSKMNLEASGMGGMYATQFINDFNALRNSVDAMISKCANEKISTCNVGTWSISPSLPLGLSINTNTGVISGKANQTLTANYTITFTPIVGSPILTNWKLNILKFDLSSLQ